MKLLLDSHALLWAITDPEKLSGESQAALASERTVVVSAVSVWEITIKQAIGKLVAPAGLVDIVAQSGFEPLQITLEHGVAAGSLPRHHHDPFDRMLIAQAQLEGLTIVTRDRAFGLYDVPVLPA